MNESRLLSVSEVCTKLGVHANTVRNMAEDGRLQGMKTKGNTGHWRFREEDIDAFIRNGQFLTDSHLKHVLYMLDSVPSEVKIDNGSYSNEHVWDHILKNYGIRSVFGSYAINTDMQKYRDILRGKEMVWIGEGAANFKREMDLHSKSDTYGGRMAQQYIYPAVGVKVSTGIYDIPNYYAVSLLVVTDENKENKWVIDGTLQATHYLPEKGLVIMPIEEAKKFYLDFRVYEDKAEFAKDYEDPQFIEKLKQNVKGNEE